MKTIILLLVFMTTAASAQHEYLRIYQVTYSSHPKQRGEIRFDFGVKYDSAQDYARVVAPKNLIASIEFAEGKGWEYVTTFTEAHESDNVINVLMRRRRE